MKNERNLVFVPARDGKPAHYFTEITLNYRRVRRSEGYLQLADEMARRKGRMS